MELTIFVQETWLRVWSEVGPTTGSPALNPGSSGWHAILLSMPCVSGRCSVWTQMMTDGVRSSPASGEPSPYTLAARTQDAERLAHSLANSGARLSRSPRTALSRRFISTGDIRDCGSAGLYRSFQNLSRTGNAAAAVRGRNSMNIDHHETFQRMIDESLAGAIQRRRNNLFASISPLALHARSISAPATGLSRASAVFPSR
jgi:hypothetical protein